MSNIQITYKPRNEHQVKKVFDTLMVWFEGDRSQVIATLGENPIAQQNADDWELTLNQNVDIHPQWSDQGIWYVRGKTVKDEGIVYNIIQSHTSQIDRKPANNLSLFRKAPVIYPGEKYPRWDSIGLLDSENNWDQGERVMWNNKEWESDIDNNIYEPGVSQWTEIVEGGASGVDCRNVDPWNASDHWSTYSIGDQRTSNGGLYECKDPQWAQSFAPHTNEGLQYGWDYIGECN